MVSIIVPCYNEAETLNYYYPSVTAVLDKIGEEYELLFVDDGSKDETLKQLQKMASEDSKVKFISFSKNFGKEAAMIAGLKNACGDYIVVMDADLQDPPELLEEMLKIIKTGEYDSVATRRVDRKGEPIIRSFFARMFYKLINKISDTEIVDGARDYRMMNRAMLEAILSMEEYNRFSKGFYGWVGFKTYWLSFENTERVAGETKWSFWKLFKYAIGGIINFSQVPLSVVSWIGTLSTFFSFVFLLFIMIRRLAFGNPVAGWASTIVVILFIGGVQLLSMGIMGQYLAKVYLEVKKRPHYIIAETNVKEANLVG